MTPRTLSEGPPDTVEVIGGAASPPILLTCEHASNHLPDGWSWPESDRRLVDMHWAWDPGAAAITRALAARLGAPAVLSRFTRLLIDPNRPLDSETLLRDVADGLPVGLNTGVTAQDRARRIEVAYAPFHAAVDAMVGRHPGVDLLSIHTYTPLYEGTPREVQLGVLFDLHEAWAETWFAGLDGQGYDVRRNEPWSGRNGLMYSVQRHAVQHGRKAVEIEVRQDLACDPVHQARIVELLAGIVRRLR